MSELMSSHESNVKVLPPIENVSGLNKCCVETVELLSANNSMMVCNDCKQIIKIFREDKSYRNYLRFCEGRQRVLQTGFHVDKWVVVYHSYDA